MKSSVFATNGWNSVIYYQWIEGQIGVKFFRSERHCLYSYYRQSLASLYDLAPKVHDRIGLNGFFTEHLPVSLECRMLCQQLTVAEAKLLGVDLQKRLRVIGIEDTDIDAIYNSGYRTGGSRLLGIDLGNGAFDVKDSDVIHFRELYESRKFGVFL